MIAALYVQKDGAYYGLPDVDPWDEERDARLYDGPWPVVAHPPCARWSRLAYFQSEPRIGDDGGSFASALSSVRRFGGVLEHPANTYAWRTFGLPRPAERGWVRSLYDAGWVCEVDQHWYGLPFRKPTWLYVCGLDDPPAMLWGRSPRTLPPVSAVFGGSSQHNRARTPEAFRDELLAMARSAQPSLEILPARADAV